MNHGAIVSSSIRVISFNSEMVKKNISELPLFLGQTQYCFDIKRFKEYMHQIRDMGLHEQAYILVGVGPLRSYGVAKFMRTKVPGVVIPDEIVERLRKTPKECQQAEGKKICTEIFQQTRKIEGVAGVPIMAYRQEELVAEIVHEAGLLPR